MDFIERLSEALKPVAVGLIAGAAAIGMIFKVFESFL